MKPNAYGRFAQVPHALLDAEVSSAAIHLYAILWRYTDRDDREAWPSRATLAAALGKSTDTVDRLIRELVAVGAVEVVRRRTAAGDNLSNVYRVLVMPEPVEDDVDTPLDAPENDAGGWPHGCGPLAAPVRPPGRMDAARTRTTDPEPMNQSTTPTPLPVPVDDFDRFWAAFPRKHGKAAARKAWGKAIRTVPAEQIIAAAVAYAEHPHRPEVQFVPHASTWLNGERWDDPPPAPRQAGVSPTSRAVDVVAMAQRMQALQSGAQREVER